MAFCVLSRNNNKKNCRIFFGFEFIIFPIRGALSVEPCRYIMHAERSRINSEDFGVLSSEWLPTIPRVFYSLSILECHFTLQTLRLCSRVRLGVPYEDHSTLEVKIRE